MHITHAQLIKGKTVLWFNLNSITDLPSNLNHIVIDNQVYAVIQTDHATSIIGRVNFAVMIDDDKPENFINKDAAWR